MAKITLETTRLQNTLVKAVKGAGYSKLLPITGMIGIRLAGKELTFTTTDGANYLYLSLAVESDDVVDITVDAEVFAKLVSKLTSEMVTLETKDGYLVVKSNGSYKLPIQLGDNGEPLCYPNPLSSVALDPDTPANFVFEKATIDVMLNTLKPSLSQVVGSVYSGYYVGDIVVSTDKSMLCAFDVDVANGNTALIFSRSLVDLLGLISDTAEVYLSENSMLIRGGNVEILTQANYNTEDFQVDKVCKLLDIAVDSYCKVNKQVFLSALERLSIFVGPYDDSAINLCFTKEGIEVSSMNSSGVEVIGFMESKDHTDTDIKIDINRLIAQLKAYTSDSVEIYYGSKSILKLKDGNITQIIALMV